MVLQDSIAIDKHITVEMESCGNNHAQCGGQEH